MLHFELHPVYFHAVIVFGQHTDSFLLRQDVKTAKEKNTMRVRPWSAMPFSVP